MELEILNFRTFLHYFLHLGFPALIAYLFFNKPKGNWLKSYFILLASMLIDLDHLLASPIFDPSRCSIGFHPLHTLWAAGVYSIFLFPKKTRILAIGLILHLATDYIDCLQIG